MSTTPFVVNHEGKKHNIDRFLRFHPGGTNTLSRLKDADVTDRLLATHHSAAAYELLKDYRVDDDDVRKRVRDDGDLEVNPLNALSSSFPSPGIGSVSRRFAKNTVLRAETLVEFALMPTGFPSRRWRSAWCLSRDKYYRCF